VAAGAALVGVWAAGAEPDPVAVFFELSQGKADEVLLTPQCQGQSGICDRILGPLTTAIENRVQVHIEMAYRGKQLKVMAPEVPPGGSLDSLFEPGAVIHVPICNLEHPGEKEISTNHRGERCGRIGEARLGGGDPCPVCGMDNCPAEADRRRARGEPVKRAVTLGVELQVATMERERAWLRGAFIAEVRLALAGMLKEIRSGRRVPVGPRCDAALKDRQFVTATASTRDLEEKWDQVNGGRKIACHLDPGPEHHATDAPTIVESTDRRIGNQAACYLNATMSALQIGVGHVAVCEILDRAERRWREVTYPRLAPIPYGLLREASQACAGSSPEQMLACVNQHYSSHVEKAFRDETPPNQSDCMFVPGPVPSGMPVAPGEVPRLSYELGMCPLSAPDCGPCDDILDCVPGLPFTLGQVDAMASFASDIASSRANLAEARTLLSKADVMDFVWRGPSEVPGSPRPAPSFGPPEPSPRPSASPSPDPADQPSLR
jgi:hypothetical protein